LGHCGKKVLAPEKKCFRFVCFAVPAWSSSTNAVLMPLFTPFRRTMKVLAPGMRNCKRRFADIDGIAINAANVLQIDQIAAVAAVLSR